MPNNQLTFEVTVTDLWNDGCGWSANCGWVKRYRVTVPDTLSDLAIARRLKREANIQNMRTDDWSGCEFSWRDGCVGAYAELVE